MTPTPNRKNAGHGAVRGRAANSHSHVTHPNTGIAPGAIVQTLHGERLIETLSAGDRIKSSCGSYLPLVSVTRNVAPARTLCRIAPHALPDSRPATRDPLIASKAQPIWISGWLARAMFGREDALTPLSTLIDGELIAPITHPTELPLFQLHTAAPTLLMVGGLRLLATPQWVLHPVPDH